MLFFAWMFYFAWMPLLTIEGGTDWVNPMGREGRGRGDGEGSQRQRQRQWRLR